MEGKEGMPWVGGERGTQLERIVSGTKALDKLKGGVVAGGELDKGTKGGEGNLCHLYPARRKQSGRKTV